MVRWRVPDPPLFLITDSLLLGSPIESAPSRRSVDLSVPVLVDQVVNAFGVSTPAGSRGCLPFGCFAFCSSANAGADFCDSSGLSLGWSSVDIEKLCMFLRRLEAKSSRASAKDAVMTACYLVEDVDSGGDWRWAQFLGFRWALHRCSSSVSTC